jgi:hypothetical protein
MKPRSHRTPGRQFTEQPVERILKRFPDARHMFAHLGIAVPERDGQKFPSPGRPDHHPSCTIKGGRFYDWSQGDGKGLDAIGVYALVKGLSNAEAIRALAETDAPISPLPRPQTLQATKPAKPPFTKLEEPTPDDLAALGKLRGIFDTALKIAARAGHLFFADTKEGRAYVVTDGARRVCQSRRLDGQPWHFIASKAWTSIKENGSAGWPLGAADIGDRQRVLLTEGGPDWLVAHEAEPEIAVCTMLGAKQTIHADALPHFAGKTVRILAHGDEAGHEACLRWALQLTEAGARVTAVCLNFDGATDLNDCAKLPLASLERHKIPLLLS